MATKAIIRYRNRKVKRHHTKAKMTFPIAIIAGLATPVIHSMSTQKTWDSRMKQFTMDMTGYNAWAHKWNPSALKFGLLPVIAGVLIHKLVGSTLGLNGILSRAGVPFIRI